MSTSQLIPDKVIRAAASVGYGRANGGCNCKLCCDEPVSRIAAASNLSDAGTSALERYQGVALL
ncbi:MAG TPA: hypothetical protein VI653_20805 [Steroidobacteraceae bacterium]